MVARLLPGVENPNHLAGAEVGVETRQQCPTQADIAGAGFLQEAVASGVYAPHCKREIYVTARLATAVFAGAIDAAEGSHASP
ncbi:MAG: hypothetical protein WA830_01005 [Candidatus Sulfotelmatobacter sp.]